MACKGDFCQDVHYAWRQSRSAPGFTALVIATLAIGIGANAIMAGALDRLLLRPISTLMRTRIERIQRMERIQLHSLFLFSLYPFHPLNPFNPCPHERGDQARRKPRSNT